MSIPASTLRKLAALHLNAEQMAGVLDILADGIEAEDARKQAQRERTRRARERARNDTVTLRERDSNRDDTHGRVTRGDDKTSTQRIEPQEENKKRATSALSPEFDEFWDLFPNKTGKPVALKAFGKARQRASQAVIMAGLRAYIANKPPDRPWLNPSTFLNQDRWGDQPASVTPSARASPAPKPLTLAGAFGLIAEAERNREDRPRADEPAVFYLPAASGGGRH